MEGDAYKKGQLSLDKKEEASITRTKRTEGFNVQLLTTFAGPKSRTSSNEHSRAPKHGFCKNMLSTWEAGDWTHWKSSKTRNLDCERTLSGSCRKSSDWLPRRRPQIRTKKKKKEKKRREKTNYPGTERVPFSDKFSELRKPDFRQDSRGRSSGLLAAPNPPIDMKLEAVVESLPSLEKATATRQRLGGKGGG